jgi:hypothetical protein
MPTGPSRLPQTINERKTIRVDSPSRRPKSLVSITLSSMKLMVMYPAVAITALPIPNCTRARSTAGTAAIVEPTFGT